MRYGLIAQQLGHSFSKPIHEKLAGYTYDLMPMPPQEVGPFLQRREFAAINVTIPYKETVIPYCDEVDEAARANQVYPLDEGSMVKFLQGPPRAPLEPVRILAGTPTLERHHSALLTQGLSWQVTIDWAYRPGDEGVVLAHGGQSGGYQLHVEDGALWLEQNQYGAPRRFGPVPLAEPSSLLELRVEVVDNRWSAELLVDGEERLRVPELIRFSSYLPFEGIDVGICRRSPVSWDVHERHRSFPFTGVLRSATYHPDPDTWQQVDARLEEARALALEMQ